MAEKPNKIKETIIVDNPSVDKDLAESDTGALKSINSKDFDVVSSSELEVLQDNPDDIEDYPEDYPDYYSALEESLVEEGAINILSKREDVRGRLATIYTIATFTMFALGFLVALLDSLITKNSLIDNLTAILPLISGIFLGTLGFVLGYYFRQAESDDAR